MFVNFNILNQLGSPAINSNTFANRPAAGQTGRLFVSTDTFEIYRDNGTTWDLIGGPGSSTITGTGQATEVAFFTSSQAIASSANLFWDNTNQYLGIGTSVPNAGVNVQDVDALGVLSNITTFAGTSTSSVSVWAKNTTNSAGYAGIFEEITPNSAAGQYPIKISHTLSSGTAAANMATGIHFGLPDNTGTERINQLSVDTVDPIAATYSNRYRFLLRSNGAAVTPFYITGTGLGVFTATPGAALDIHSTGIMAQLNSTSATANSLMAFQRSGSGLWRIGDQYNGGNNFFELHNTVLTNNAIQVLASSNEATFLSSKTYTTGNAIGVAVQHNLTIPNAVNVGLAAIGGVNSNLNLTLGGSTTVAATGRQGLEGSTSIRFTGAGTLTMTQGSTVRAFSALSSVYAFNGSAVGTITHLAGLRICFPDNVGSAVNITNNYALLINNQTTGTGTVTYTNRWGIYQEGSLDTNYLNGTTLIGTTVNAGYKLDVNGSVNGASFYTTSRYIVNSTSSSGVSDISLGSYANGLWINTPSGTTGYLAVAGSAAYSFASNLHTWYTDAGSGILPRMTLISTGLLGLNTTSPNELLSLGFADNANNSIEFRSATYARLALITGGNNASSSNGYLAFSTRNGGSINEVMRLTTNSRVGINEINPSLILDIQSTAAGSFPATSGTTQSTGGRLRLTTTGAATAVIDYGTAGGSGGWVQVTNKSDLSTNYAYSINPNGGNVLIGTTTDAGQKLQVNGTGSFGGTTILGIQTQGEGQINSPALLATITDSDSNIAVFRRSFGVNTASCSLQLQMYNSSNTYKSYASLHNQIIDNTSGSEDGRFFVNCLKNGSSNTELIVDGNGIKTDNPTTGTAAAWKLGSRVAAAVALDATQYIQVEVGGVFYKLAIVT